MTGLDAFLGQSSDRWAHAHKRAQGVEDNGLGDAVRTYYTRYLPAGLLVLLAAGSIAGMLGAAGNPPDWAAYSVFGILLAALGAVTGGLVYNSKRVIPAARPGRVDVLLSLETGERKQVRRHIAGKAAATTEHLPVARAAAVQLRKALATQFVLAPFFLLLYSLQAALLAARRDSFWWVMAVGLGVVLLAMAFLVRDFRRAGRFLRRTSDGAGPGGT